MNSPSIAMILVGITFFTSGNVRAQLGNETDPEDYETDTSTEDLPEYGATTTTEQTDTSTRTDLPEITTPDGICQGQGEITKSPDYDHPLVGTGKFAVVYSIRVPEECVVEVSYQFIEPNPAVVMPGGCAIDWVVLRDVDGREVLMDRCTALDAPGTATSKTSYVDILTYPDMYQATGMNIKWNEKVKITTF